MIIFKMKQFLLQISIVKTALTLNILCKIFSFLLYKNDSNHVILVESIGISLRTTQAIWRTKIKLVYF